MKFTAGTNITLNNSNSNNKNKCITSINNNNKMNMPCKVIIMPLSITIKARINAMDMDKINIIKDKAITKANTKDKIKENLIIIEKDKEIINKENAMEDKVIIIEERDQEENKDTEKISIKKDIINIIIKGISFNMNKKQL